MTVEPEMPREDFESDVAYQYSSMTSGYVSPLVARMSTSRLTVDMLKEEVPVMRAGEAAAAKLSEGNVPVGSAQWEELSRERREGERAKERLFTAALPLIRVVAVKEWRRRQQWRSQVPLEDLVQDANLGFLKGLAAFNPDAVRRSATNYLGQWMLVEMRRASESMDHDLKVGRDVGERFRRIRALRSRLASDLDREPSDEEVAAASRDPKYVTRPSMLGRAPETGGKVPVGEGVTVEQVAEERMARGRIGHSYRFDPSSSDEDGANRQSLVDPERIIVDASHAAHQHDPAALLSDESGRRVIAGLVSRVIDAMGLPKEQRNIVALRYGLPPHEGEMSVREISRTVGVHRERVMRILDAFSGEMTTPGGPFHAIVSNLSEDDLDAVGLLWVAEALGPWDATAAARHRIPRVLTEEKQRTQPQPNGQTEASGCLAWFVCPRRSHRFSALYEHETAVPNRRPCPTCGSQTVLLRIEHHQNP